MFFFFFWFHSKRNIRIIHIDLSLPIEEQGDLDLIVHKMTDLVAKIERGDIEAKLLFDRFTVRCITILMLLSPFTINSSI